MNFLKKKRSKSQLKIPFITLLTMWQKKSNSTRVKTWVEWESGSKSDYRFFFTKLIDLGSHLKIIYFFHPKADVYLKFFSLGCPGSNNNLTLLKPSINRRQSTDLEHQRSPSRWKWFSPEPIILRFETLHSCWRWIRMTSEKRDIHEQPPLPRSWAIKTEHFQVQLLILRCDLSVKDWLRRDQLAGVENSHHHACLTVNI